MTQHIHEQESEQLAEIVKRLEALEQAVFVKGTTKKVLVKGTTSGVAGGITLLFQRGFFKEPRALSEIHEELQREGYHYSLAAINTAILRKFLRNSGILTRVQKDKKWNYVERK